MSEYSGMIDLVQQGVGISLELWDTGGGCTALQAFLESDITVVVTDSPYSTNGQEAQITGERERRLLGEDTVGFFVGVYRDEGSTPLITIDTPMAVIDQLPFFVKMALDAAVAANRAA